MPRRASSFITASICGGLGNQLFQLANLIATTARHGGLTDVRKRLEEQTGNLPAGFTPESHAALQAVMERSRESDSIDEPRPTYWGSAFARFCEVCPPLPSRASLLAGDEASLRGLPSTVTAVGEQCPMGAHKCSLPITEETKQRREEMKRRAQPSITAFLSSVGMTPPTGRRISSQPIDYQYIYGPILYNLIGFYQSQRYFDDYEGLVRHLLLDPALLSIGAGIVSSYGHVGPGGGEKALGTHASPKNLVDDENHDDNHYIAVHVRRGDYLKYADTFETLGPRALRADGAGGRGWESLSPAPCYYDAALQRLLGNRLLTRSQRREFFGSFCVNKTQRADESTTAPLLSSTPLDSSSLLAGVGEDTIGRCAASALKVLLFTDDYAYGTLLSQLWMKRYPSLHVMVVGAGTEAQSGIVVPTAFTPSSLFESHIGGAATAPNTAAQQNPLPRDVMELYMIAACDDVIIANSTFSWWGAYLNPHCHRDSSDMVARPDANHNDSPCDAPRSGPLGRVIAPSKWFVKDSSSHLYCRGWTVM